jgi:phage gp16-like protein
MPQDNRRALLAKVHIAKKALAMADDSYRALLKRVAGGESAGDLPTRSS